MKIVRIAIKEKENKIIYVHEATLIKEIGIKGDKNANGGLRQLSLLPKRVRDSIEDGSLSGLCVSRFQENITYDGEDELILGQKYKIGEAIIEISDLKKKCFPECDNIIRNIPCLLVNHVKFAKIFLGGCIETNYEINTLSPYNTED